MDANMLFLKSLVISTIFYDLSFFPFPLYLSLLFIDQETGRHRGGRARKRKGEPKRGKQREEKEQKGKKR
jgi:hypothetical protein